MSILGATTVNCNSLLPIGGVPSGATGGGIIQIVQTNKTDTFFTTTNAFVDVTGLSVTITPRSTSNKILILSQINQSTNPNGGQTIRLTRGGTAINIGDAAGTRTQGTTLANYLNIYTILSASIMFVDSPATTSATTYAIQVFAVDGYGVGINRNNYDADRKYDARTTSSIIALEVSG